MKYSNYFHHTREREDTKEIKMEWIEEVFRFPEKEYLQKDGRIRRWRFIKENGRYLRIVILEDKETIHMLFLIGHIKKNNNEDHLF